MAGEILVGDWENEAKQLPIHGNKYIKQVLTHSTSQLREVFA